MNMGKTMAVTDAIDALVAEAYRRMRDAGLSHVEAAECLKRWEGAERAPTSRSHRCPASRSR
jgi:hypothetical protein